MEDQSITTHQLEERLKNRHSIQLIDVREDEEAAMGMISSAKHIPMGELPYRLNELEKETECYIICRSGARSARVCDFLQQKGYKAINIEGGMNHWMGDTIPPR